jgi:hypothetical protein
MSSFHTRSHSYFHRIILSKWTKIPLSVPSITATGYGLHCYLPIIQSSINLNIAIAILASKWEPDCYVGLVLRRVLDDTGLPVYAIKRWNTEKTSHRRHSPPRDDSSALRGLFFVPDGTRSIQDGQEHAALRHVKSAFWRDLMTHPSTLQWIDIYIQYRHDPVGTARTLDRRKSATLAYPSRCATTIVSGDSP